MPPAAVRDHPYRYAQVLGIYDLRVSPFRQDPTLGSFPSFGFVDLATTDDPNYVGDFDPASLCRVGFVRFGGGSDFLTLTLSSAAAIVYQPFVLDTLKIF